MILTGLSGHAAHAGAVAPSHASARRRPRPRPARSDHAIALSLDPPATGPSMKAPSFANHGPDHPKVIRAGQIGFVRYYTPTISRLFVRRVLAFRDDDRQRRRHLRRNHMQIALHPLNSRFGAEVAGIDPSQPLDAETFEQIEQAFDRHSLLLFRGQTMSEEGSRGAQPAFRHLAEPRPEALPLQRASRSHRAVEYQGERPTDRDRGRRADLACRHFLRRDAVPVLAAARARNSRARGRSHLRRHRLPGARPPPTMHCPEEEARRWQGSRRRTPFIHYYKLKQAQGSDRPDYLTKEQESEVPPVDQPVVLAHPITGRKAIYVNPSYTTRSTTSRKRRALRCFAELFAHLVKPEFVYRHQWRPGDLIIWGQLRHPTRDRRPCLAATPPSCIAPPSCFATTPKQGSPRPARRSCRRSREAVARRPFSPPAELFPQWTHLARLCGAVDSA